MATTLTAALAPALTEDQVVGALTSYLQSHQLLIGHAAAQLSAAQERGDSAAALNWAAILSALVTALPQILAIIQLFIPAAKPTPVPTPTPTPSGPAVLS